MDAEQLTIFDYEIHEARFTSCRDCCQKCLYWWSHRCPNGGCYDDFRAKHYPREKLTGEHRTGWSNCERPGEQDHWCRGGRLYTANVEKLCPHFVEYEGQTVKECLKFNVCVFQDGYIDCGYINGARGCEECYAEFLEKQNQEEETT